MERMGFNSILVVLENSRKLPFGVCNKWKSIDKYLKNALKYKNNYLSSYCLFLSFICLLVLLFAILFSQYALFTISQLSKSYQGYPFASATHAVYINQHPGFPFKRLAYHKHHQVSLTATRLT